MLAFFFTLKQLRSFCSDVLQTALMSDNHKVKKVAIFESMLFYLLIFKGKKNTQIKENW